MLGGPGARASRVWLALVLAASPGEARLERADGTSEGIGRRALLRQVTAFPERTRVARVAPVVSRAGAWPAPWRLVGGPDLSDETQAAPDAADLLDACLGASAFVLVRAASPGGTALAGAQAFARGRGVLVRWAEIGPPARRPVRDEGTRRLAEPDPDARPDGRGRSLLAEIAGAVAGPMPPRPSRGPFARLVGRVRPGTAV